MLWIPGNDPIAIAYREPNLLTPNEKPVGVVQGKPNVACFYLFNEIDSIDLVSGSERFQRFGGNAAASKITQGVKTSGNNDDYLQAPFPLDSLVGCTIVVGQKHLSGGAVRWGILRNDTNVWNGIYQQGSENVTFANNNNFDLSLTPTIGKAPTINDSYFTAITIKDGEVRASINGGPVSSDAGTTFSTGSGLQICLGASVRSLLTDNESETAFYYYGIIDGNVSDTELKQLSGNVFSELLEQANDSPMPIYMGTGGGITLSINNATHAHAADNLALTQANNLVIDESAHAHATDNLDLTQANTLSIDENSHAQVVDNIDLQQDNVLIINQSVHNHIVDSLTLTQAVSLIIAEALHSHASGNIDLQQANVLTIDESVHAHLVANVTLSLAGSLSISNAAHGLASSNIDLIQANTLSINDTLHSLSSASLLLGQANVLSIQGALHSHTGESITLDTGVVLGVNDTAHAVISSAPELVQANVLSILNAVHTHSASSTDLITNSTLMISKAVHAHLSANIDLVDGVIDTPVGTVFVVPAKERVFLIADSTRVFNIQ